MARNGIRSASLGERRVRLFDGILRSSAAFLLGGLLLPLAACAQGAAQGGDASAQGSAAVEVAEQDFDAWLAGVKQEAIGRGIRRETVESAFAGLEPLPEVVQRDRTQREFTLTFTGARKSTRLNSSH